MKTLVIVLDSVTKKDLVDFLENVYNKAKYHGQLVPIGTGHTVTSAFALMTGKIPYNTHYGYNCPIGDWVWRTDGRKFRQDNMEMYTYDDVKDDSLIGKSGLKEVWFNIPMTIPIPRVNAVIVGGIPLAGYEYYTQPPWLQEELERMDYIVDVKEDTKPTPDYLIRMEEKRADALNLVLDRFEWDVAFAWFTALDRLHHNRVHLKGVYDNEMNRRSIMSSLSRIVYNLYSKYKPDYLFVLSDHGWLDEVNYHWNNGIYAIFDGKSYDNPEVRASIIDVLPTVYALHGVKREFVGKPVFERQNDTFILPNEKYLKSFEIIKNTFKTFNPSQIAVSISGGKDSTAVAYMAWLVDKNVKLIFVDTRAHFKDTWFHINELKNGFNMNIYVAQPTTRYLNYAEDKVDCCHVNKIQNLQHTLELLGIKVLLTGIRRDDGGGRETTPVSEVRKTETGYDYLQVNPILDWNYDDVMNFLLSEGVPINPLYYNGYRSIDCYPCTLSIFDVPEQAKHERAGRIKQEVLGRLRSMGYF